MLGDLRAKDLSIISRASHSLKKVCWVFPFFDFYLQSLNDKWHDIQCMTHMGYWPLCRVLVRMVATSHVNHTNLSFPNPQTFLLIVSILVKVNWNLEKILRECIDLSLFATEMLPTSSSRASFAISVKVFRMTKTSGHCFRISNSWNLTTRKPYWKDELNHVHIQFSYFWSQML